jgi:hypothetical protein
MGRLSGQAEEGRGDNSDPGGYVIFVSDALPVVLKVYCERLFCGNADFLGVRGKKIEQNIPVF